MSELPYSLGLLVGPMVAAFVINAVAEWVLMSSDRRIFVTLAKSAKATIVPALIALYALIIANIIVGSNG